MNVLSIFQKLLHDSGKTASEEIINSANEEYIKIVNKANTEHDRIIAAAMAEKDQLLSAAQQELDVTLSSLEKERDELTKEIRELSVTRADLIQEIQELRDSFSEISKNTADTIFGRSAVEQNWKTKYLLLVEQEKQLVKSECAVDKTDIGLNETEYKRRSKQIIRCFNAEVNPYVHSAAPHNIDSTKNKIVRAFNGLNKLYEKDGICLSHQLLELKLKQSDTVCYSKE